MKTMLKMTELLRMEIPELLLGKVGNDGRLKGYFCSEVVFNLSHRVLSDLEIDVLDKDWFFSHTIIY